MRQIISIALFAIAALLLTLLPGGLWGGLLTANLKTGIAIPWAVLAMAIILWLAWRYAGGHGPPASTSLARRRYRRANPVAGGVFAWALLANALALTALAGLWIVLFQLVKIPGNAPPDFSKYSWVTVGLLLVTSAVAGAICEEVGMRGYLQGRLERSLPPPAAIVIAALVLAPGHALTQGFVWPILLFYFLADVTYGATAWLTDSILPGIVAHGVGLLVFLALIWPHDAARAHILAGGDAWFWIHAAQALVCGGLAVGAFWRLARITAATRATPSQVSSIPA
jgi:membrane protease YdiL (CAAX protease family)